MESWAGPENRARREHHKAKYHLSIMTPVPYLCVTYPSSLSPQSVHACSNILRRHTSIPASEALCPPAMCHTHPTELLKYFCEDDKVPICSGCAIMGTHRGHAVVSVADAVSVCVRMCACRSYVCACVHVRRACVYLTVG